jgi:hypothetical protein
MIDELDPISGGEQVLDHVREVARRITDRVRRVTEDTTPESPILWSSEETARAIPLQPPQTG